MTVPKHAVAAEQGQDIEHAIHLFMVAIGTVTLWEKPNGELVALSLVLVI